MIPYLSDSAKDAPNIEFLAVPALIGYNSMIFLKLWLWVVNTKLSTLEEMKQLQLQIAELAGEEKSSET